MFDERISACFTVKGPKNFPSSSHSVGSHPAIFIFSETSIDAGVKTPFSMAGV